MVVVFEILELTYSLVYEMGSHLSALFLAAFVGYFVAWPYFGSSGSSTSSPSPSLDYIMFAHDFCLGRISYNNFSSHFWYHTNQ